MSLTPTFNGVPLFGIVFEMNTGDDERELQQNAYFGLTGIETINGGGRGRKTVVSGQHVAPDELTLAAFQAIVRSYRDGRNYVLVEGNGNAWPQVQLASFSLQGRRMLDAGTGQVLQNYSAVFQHMI